MRVFRERGIGLIKWFSPIMVAVLFFSGCNVIAGGTVLDNYKYPFRPGTAAWKALGDHSAMLKACQVPENTLKNMSTAGLVETVLDYPLLPDMMAWNFVQDGFDAVFSNFCGLQELFQRPDAGTELLACYHDLDPLAISNDWTDLEKGAYAFNFQYIEVILAQKPVIEKLTSAQRRELLNECLTKYRAKQQLPDLYSIYSLDYLTWTMGRVLEQTGYAPFIEKMSGDNAIQNFLTKGSFALDYIPGEILTQSECYLTEP
jgi:hypothetical protein